MRRVLFEIVQEFREDVDGLIAVLMEDVLHRTVDNILNV